MRGVEVLTEAMDDPDIAVRLRAARCAFSFAPSDRRSRKAQGRCPGPRRGIRPGPAQDPPEVAAPGQPGPSPAVSRPRTAKLRKSERKWQEMAGNGMENKFSPSPTLNSRQKWQVSRPQTTILGSIRRKNGRKIETFPATPLSLWERARVRAVLPGKAKNRRPVPREHQPTDHRPL